MKTCDILGDHTGASASEIEISTEKNPGNGSDIPKTAITIGIITIKKKNLGSSSSLFSNKPKAPFEKPGELFLCRVVSGSIFPSRILNWGSTILRWKRGKLGYGVRDLGYKNGPATAKFIKCFFDPTIELSVGNIHV